MKIRFREYMDNDITDIVQLSQLAWGPVFTSFRRVLGSNIFPILYPDWKKSQKDGVEKICKDKEKFQVLVAELESIVVGFLAYGINQQDETGEVQLLAVHPKYQNLGIGTELNLLALKKLKDAGLRLAKVETGGDESHAPARKVYEKAGYIPLPLVRYFKEL